jgi:hypothetical protein
MKFFVPGVSSARTEATYQELFEAAKSQLRTSITPKRIFSLRYIHDKRTRVVTVGETHPEYHRYRILAILESQPHIVLTQDRGGKAGPTFMVNTTEITEVVEFS